VDPKLQILKDIKMFHTIVCLKPFFSFFFYIFSFFSILKKSIKMKLETLNKNDKRENVCIYFFLFLFFPNYFSIIY